MTKEQLLELGLNEDQIKEVFKLNGIAVGNAKKGVDLLETEIENLNEQLKTANKEIEGFKGVDVKELENKIESYKTKYEESKTNYEKELDTIKFNHELENTLRGYNPHDVKDILGFIDVTTLKQTDKGITGIDEQITLLKESKPYLFPEVATNKKPEFNSFKLLDSNSPGDKPTSIGSKFAEKRNSESKITTNLWG